MVKSKKNTFKQLNKQLFSTKLKFIANKIKTKCDSLQNQS